MGLIRDSYKDLHRKKQYFATPSEWYAYKSYFKGLSKPGHRIEVSEENKLQRTPGVTGIIYVEPSFS